MEFWNLTLQLLEGFGTTCLIFFLTLLFALPLGLLVSFGSMSKFKIVKLPVRFLIWIIRGTPLMLQIIIIFFIPSIVFKIPFNKRMLAAVIAFSINYAAYFSEIFRGGIEAIPRGQYEAAKVLGLNKWQTFTRITLTQVVKNILAPMSNEIITLVKDTSLVRVIAVAEIIMEAEGIVSATGSLLPLLYTGVFYLIFNGVLTQLFSLAEKKLKYYR